MTNVSPHRPVCVSAGPINVLPSCMILQLWQNRFLCGLHRRTQESNDLLGQPPAGGTASEAPVQEARRWRASAQGGLLPPAGDQQGPGCLCLSWTVSAGLGRSQAAAVQLSTGGPSGYLPVQLGTTSGAAILGGIVRFGRLEQVPRAPSLPPHRPGKGAG